jgi:L-ascorbate metabolism protein UlaG (beta-lactamase superfamily)
MSEPAFARHFNSSRFYNPNGVQARGLADVLRWKLSSRPEPSPRFVSDVNQSIPPRHVEKDKLLATLVNHSTVLLQQGATNILTDPIWSERTSPVSWAGPRRHRKPGMRMEDLPDIDLVLISHNHYDHLDLPTLRRLAARGNSTFIAPRGVGKLLRSAKIGPVHELDWGEEWTNGATTVSSVPALHFSGRGLSDRNKTLWCGYVIGSGKGVVYFAADTAFGDHFAQIRAKFGSPRLALLPIGAYKPRWFMSSVHMSPEEAIEAHRIVGSATSIGIHHGTFQLADDGIDTAKKEFMRASPPDSFLIPENGQSVAIP